MKPVLVVGLGNSLMGDDGIGEVVVERLARDTRLRDRVDFRAGGSDLLRLADAFAGRERVVVIDAVLCDDPPGTVTVDDEPFDGCVDRQQHAHHPCAVASIALLKCLTPSLRHTRFTLIGVAVGDIRHEATLAPRVGEITGHVREALLNTMRIGCAG